MEKQKIIRTIIITLVFLLVIAGIIVYAVHNDSKNLILGTWEATAEDGTVVSYQFTTDYENASTKETIYYLTVKNPDGSTETEKGTYNISNDTVVTFRPIADGVTDNATASFSIKKDTLHFEYTVDFETKEIDFKKVKAEKK